MKKKLTHLLLYFGILTSAHIITVMLIKGGWPEMNDLLGAFAFGLILAIVFTEMQVFFSGKKKNVSISESGEQPQRKLTIRGEANKVLGQLKTSLSEKKWQLLSEDTQRGQLEFRTGVSWRSWGEVIYVKALQKEGGEVNIDIYSLPAWRRDENDADKHQENIEQVERILKKIQGS